jgi:hypothetical protein
MVLGICRISKIIVVIAHQSEISVVDPDPDWIRYPESIGSPDPDSQSGSGARKEKMTH